MYKTSVAIFLLNGLLITCAKPQYGPPGGASSYEGSGPAAPPPPPPANPGYGQREAQPAPPPPPAQQPAYAQPAPPPPPPPQQPAYAQPAPPPPPPPAAQPAYSSGPARGSAPGNAGGNSGAKSGGGDLTVQCKANPDPSGTIKYDCSGANKDAITLKTEHILWLESQAGSSQNLDIEIPNYNIDEFIKAAYKALGPQEGAKINILLKKPDVVYNAEKADAPKEQQQPPAVSLNYQPVDKISVHYPSQKPYSNGGGSGGDARAPQPAPPPAPQPAPAPFPAPAPAPARNNQGGGGAYSRPLRESGNRYYFLRQ